VYPKPTHILCKWPRINLSDAANNDDHEDDADDNYEGDDENGDVLLVPIPRGGQCLISFPTANI
jgi:hypothetical protein